MTKLLMMIGILAGYTLIWAGLSHYGLATFSGPLPATLNSITVPDNAGATPSAPSPNAATPGVKSGQSKAVLL